jgi:hypothetical protein
MEQTTFPDGVTATDFLALLHRSKESEKAFTFAHCEVSETYINSFTQRFGFNPSVVYVESGAESGYWGRVCLTISSYRSSLLIHHQGLVL